MFGRSSRDPFWPPALAGRGRRVLPEPLVPRRPAPAPRDGLRTLAERAALERAERERAIAGQRERERERASFEHAARRRAELERDRAAAERAAAERAEREMAARESAARERAERERTDARRGEVERAERSAAALRAESEREARERAALATGDVALSDEVGAAAEADAAKERWRREADRELEQARLDLARPLLPVLDNLDRTIEAARRDSGEGLLEGLGMVRSQLEGVLGSYGLERIASLGHPFDPTFHEAVATVAVADPDDDGRVVDEWQRGYRAGGRVLRPAGVRVGRFARP